MKKIFFYISLVILLLSYQVSLFAQEEMETDNQNTDVNITTDDEPQSGNKKLKRYLTYGTIFGSFAATYYYGATAWEWGGQDFRWADEGWFGADTDSGGIDKIGHMWAHYVLQRGFNNLFEYTLEDKTEALIVSTATAATIGLLIELGDGTSGKYGFSHEDLVIDWAGVALGAFLESFPVADEFIGFTWEYWPTDEFLDETGRKRFHVTSDYSGHKYMINFKLAGFRAIGWDIPEFMRYIMLDFGYYTRGYTSYEEPGTEKTRHPYFGISLNMIEVVRDMFDDRDSMLCKGLQQPFKYMHAPIGYEADYNLRSDNYSD